MTENSVSFGFLQSKHRIVHEKNIPTHDYDLVMLTATWEGRGSQFQSKIPRTKGIADKILVAFFKSADEPVRKKKEVFVDKIERRFGKSTTVLKLSSSIDADHNFKLIKEHLKKKKKDIGRPLKILCDISCLPKAYVAFLIGLGFRGEFATKVTFFYAEAERYSLKEGQRFSAKHNLMTVGDWSINQIPYFESIDFISDDHPLAVSLGAEIKACIPLIERIEPAQLHVIHIENFEAKIPEKVSKREEPFLKTLASKYSSKNEAFPLGSVHKVANRVLTLAEEPLRCLLLGPKLHAVGFMLAGLANDNIELNCRVPTSYSAADVSASGIFHLIEIFDRFDPGNY